MKIKRIINPSIYFFIFSGSVFLFGQKDWWPSFYDPNFLGIAFLVSAFLIFLPKIVFRTKEKQKQNLVILLSSTIAVVVLLNALGQLYFYQLYKYGFPYDKLIHFGDVFLFVVVLTFFLHLWRGLHFKKALKISVVSVLFGFLIWEVYEFGVDAIFDTKEFGIYGQYKVLDTTFDILLDFIGLSLGYFLLSHPVFSKKIEGYLNRMFLGDAQN